jgi:hypothetical protein
MVSLYITVTSICPVKKNNFLRPILSRRPALKSQGPWCRAIRRRGSVCSNRASPVGNKSQQKSTTHGRDFLPEATNINKNQQKSTESAKVSKSQQKSAKISKNHQKSALVGLVCKPLTVLLRPKHAYWNIKECVTEDRRSSYKFHLQTDL